VIARVPDEASRADLREVSEVAQTALDNVRGLSQTLHPSILDELGLESAVEWYLSTVERQHGIAVTYEREGGKAPVAAADSIHVYRILQEAISNIARHSGARAAIVRLINRGATLELAVEDAGRGLTTTEHREGRGLGLVAMRERAALLRGTLSFERPEHGGTLVRLTVPLEKAS
jgi:signal transduction histidine kinase